CCRCELGAPQGRYSPDLPPRSRAEHPPGGCRPLSRDGRMRQAPWSACVGCRRDRTGTARRHPRRTPVPGRAHGRALDQTASQRLQIAHHGRTLAITARRADGPVSTHAQVQPYGAAWSADCQLWRSGAPPAIASDPVLLRRLLTLHVGHECVHVVVDVLEAEASLVAARRDPADEGTAVPG